MVNNDLNQLDPGDLVGLLLYVKFYRSQASFIDFIADSSGHFSWNFIIGKHGGLGVDTPMNGTFISVPLAKRPTSVPPPPLLKS